MPSSGSDALDSRDFFENASIGLHCIGADRVILHLGDGALGYSSMGFWTMARYNAAMLIVVSNTESYQIVRHNWAKDMPDTKMVRDGKPRLGAGTTPSSSGRRLGHGG